MVKVKFQCPYCQAINSCSEEDFSQSLGCGSCNRVQKAPAHRFAPGIVIGDYLLKEQIRSRLGNIDHLAHQLSLERPVMLKVVKPEHNRNERFIKDFLRVARQTSQVVHPNLVYTYAAGYEDHTYFIAREAMEGEALSMIIRRDGVLMPNLAIDVIRQVAEGLAYGWRQKQLLHGNLKPDYIHLAPFGLAKIMDLGLAMLDPEPEDEHIKGTPHYLSPERITGEPLDARCDIYALGVVFYEALLNRYPFNGPTPQDVLQAHLQDELTPPHMVKPMIPVNVSLVVTTMLARDPNGRYPNGAILADDLRLVAQGKAPKFAVDQNTVKVRVLEDTPPPVAPPTAGAAGAKQSSTGGAAARKSYTFNAAATSDRQPTTASNRSPGAPEPGSQSVVLKPDREHPQIKPSSPKGATGKFRPGEGLARDTKPGPSRKFMTNKPRPTRPTDPQE